MRKLFAITLLVLAGCGPKQDIKAYESDFHYQFKEDRESHAYPYAKPEKRGNSYQ